MNVAVMREELKRLAWFVGLWFVGVTCVLVLAYAVRLLIET